MVVISTRRGRNPFLDAVVDDGHLAPGSVVKYVNGNFADSAETFRVLIADAVRRQKATGFSVIIKLDYLPADVNGHVPVHQENNTQQQQ